MTEFEKAVVAEVKRVRETLARDESLHSFHFEVRAEGRVHDGEVRISFAVGNYSANVVGNTVDAAVREYMRRNGFDTLNSGIVLTGPGEVEF